MLAERCAYIIDIAIGHDLKHSNMVVITFALTSQIQLMLYESFSAAVWFVSDVLGNEVFDYFANLIMVPMAR